MTTINQINDIKYDLLQIIIENESSEKQSNVKKWHGLLHLNIPAVLID